MKYIQKIRPYFLLVFLNLLGIAAFIAFECWVLFSPKRPIHLKTQVPFYAVCVFYYWFACYFYLPFIIKKYRSLLIRVILILVLYVGCTFFYAIVNTMLRSLIINRWIFEIGLADLKVSSGRCIEILGIAFIVWVIRHFLVHKKRTKELEHQKDEADRQLTALQNSYLRAQIKSHLFFNSLITLYPKVLNHAPEAPEVVLLLTDLLDYALKNGEENGYVELRKDIDVLEKSIQLNRLLKGRKCEMKFNFHLDEDDALVAPLLMQDFVDNIFKHGDLFDPELPAIIQIKLSNRKLHFNSKNKILPPKGLPSKGIGLNNVKERLKKLYPGKHRLYTNAGFNEFEVDLIIFL